MFNKACWGILFGAVVAVLSVINKVLPHEYLYYGMQRIFIKEMISWTNFSLLTFTGLFVFTSLLNRLTLKVVKNRDLNNTLSIMFFSAIALCLYITNFNDKVYKLITNTFINVVRKLSPGDVKLESFALTSSQNVKILFLIIIGIIILVALQWLWRRILVLPAVSVFLKKLNYCSTYLSLAIVLVIVLANMGVYLDKKINPPSGPNVILIILDTLRKDHLGCYGYERNTSPNIDAFAEDAVVFNNAFSAASWTLPSIAGIQTSQYPSVLGMRKGLTAINDNFITIAELFNNSNYRTKSVVSVLLLQAWLGFDQGYDEFDDENALDKIRIDTHISSASITQKAISFLEQNKNQKHFLFLHFFDAHSDFLLHEKYNYYPEYKGPYNSKGHPQKDLLDKFKTLSQEDIKHFVALYDSEINFIDEHLGKLFEKLKQLGLYDDSLIILTADHGEEFLERGEMIGHGITLFQEQINVPLIIKYPGNRHRGRLENYVGTIDLMPTMGTVAGITIPEKYDYAGRQISFSPDRQTNGDGRAIISEIGLFDFAKLQSVTQNGWKYVYDLAKGTDMLFDLKHDPQELQNVALNNKEKLSKLKGILSDWKKKTEIQKRQKALEVKDVTVSEAQLQQLRDLGYVQ